MPAFTLSSEPTAWRTLALAYYSPAAEMISDGFTPIASAMRTMFKNVMLRFPRSTSPMCERSTPDASANASCDIPKANRCARIAAPNFNRR